jgi:hypothetical protein
MVLADVELKAECHLQAGSYCVTYNAEDATHNVATATRTVNVISPCSSPEHFCSATCR